MRRSVVSRARSNRFSNLILVVVVATFIVVWQEHGAAGAWSAAAILAAFGVYLWLFLAALGFLARVCAAPAYDVSIRWVIVACVVALVIYLTSPVDLGLVVKASAMLE